MSGNKLQQNKQNLFSIQSSGLQFKNTKKRVLKRPSPTKSSKSNNKIFDDPKSKNHSPFIPRIKFTETAGAAYFSNAKFQDKESNNINFGKFSERIQTKGQHRRLVSEFDNRGAKRINRKNNTQINLQLNLVTDIMTKLGGAQTDRICIRRQKPNQNYLTNRSIHSLTKQGNQRNITRIISNLDIQTSQQIQFAQNFGENYNQPKFIKNQSQISSNKQFAKIEPQRDQHKYGHTRNKSQGMQISLHNKSINYQEQFSSTYKQQNFMSNEKAYNFIKNKKIKPITKEMSLNIQYSNFNQQSTGIKIKDFQLGLCIGYDIFGKMYPARHIKTGFVLCIKQIIKRQVKHQMQKFIQYIKIQSLFNHQNIVQIYGIFEQKNKIYILMEYFEEGGIYLNIKSEKKLNPIDSLNYLKQISQAIQQIHNKDIVYRNLKPQNFSFIYDTCKISNLAWSCKIENQKASYQGQIQYNAPQVLLGNKYTKQCDIWGLGILFYEMINGVTPFYNLSRKKTLDKILNQNFLQDSENLQSHLRFLMQKMLQKLPQYRISVSQLIKQIQITQKLLNEH